MALSRFLLTLPLAIAAGASLAAQSPAPAKPAATTAQRVTVTAASAPAYSCPDATCRVVIDLEKGAVVSVVKTDGEWHQVMVRLGASSVTTGWVKASQVAIADAVSTSSDGGVRGRAALVDRDPGDDGDPRGCLTCLATRTPTREEWNAALADASTRKAAPASPPVAAGIADGRTSDEKMRDAFAQRYEPELKRLADAARAVDNDLAAYLAACYERFASIPVAGAAPRSNSADEILKQARSAPGAARFALWNGTAAFAWNPTWAPQANDSSTLPSCERLWEDARGRADRLKVDVEFLERDARDGDIFPGVVREILAARGLADPASAPAPPVADVR
jgi:hypothetical protein